MWKEINTQSTMLFYIQSDKIKEAQNMLQQIKKSFKQQGQQQVKLDQSLEKLAQGLQALT